MSVNYHVFSSIHDSLLLGNPPIWSCESTNIISNYNYYIPFVSCNFLNFFFVKFITSIIVRNFKQDETNLLWVAIGWVAIG